MITQRLPVITTPELHSMGNSLLKYLEMKVHSDLAIETSEPPLKVIVRGTYDRSKGISKNEKRGKLFNFKRPTVAWEGREAILNCFPGIDYLFHFASVISTYYNFFGEKVPVIVEWPDDTLCIEQLQRSMGAAFPKSRQIVMGKVDMLTGIDRDRHWRTAGEFCWRPIFDSCEQILLGCKHTIWGDIAGRLVSLLAENGADEVIYIGKLGSLDSDDEPNTFLASGNLSLLQDGTTVTWDNRFSGVHVCDMVHGVHRTVGSVLEESNSWVAEASITARFVDPEIGPMAAAAVDHGIGFSFLHVISDNLAATAQYQHDLSNERLEAVCRARTALYEQISRAVLALSCSP